MRLLRLGLALSVTTAFFSMAACGSSKDEAPAPVGSGGVTVAQGVTILEAKSVDDVTVQADRLVFPRATHADIASKKAGDVLVGDAGISPTTPNKWGFLRKVVSVTADGDNYVVVTERADLTDVITEGELSGQLTVPSLQPDDPAASTKTLGKKGGSPIKLLDFSGKTLFAKTGSIEVQPGKTLGYEANVTLTKGTLDFTPTFDVGAKIGKPSGFSLKGVVKEAHAIATGKLDAVAEIDASFKLTGTATGEDVAALIAKKVFNKPTTVIADHKIKLPGLKLGFISVPAHAQFRAVVTCDLKWGGESRVVVGGKASATVSAGARFDGSKISPVWEHSESLEQLGPVWTINHDLGVRCAIIPELRLNLWDVAAGEVVAEAYGALEARATCNSSTLTGDVSGSAYAGVSARAKAKLDVFGLYKWEKECTLFDMHSPKATFTGSFPLGKGATCTEVPAAPTPMPTSTPAPSCFGDSTVSGGEDAGSPGTDAGGADSGSADGGGEETGSVLCDHDVCTNGGPLTTGCTKDSQAGACIKAICENDPYCCTTAWSVSCIDKVERGEYGCTPRTCPSGS
jgi:hypothetical protein